MRCRWPGRYRISYMLLWLQVSAFDDNDLSDIYSLFLTDPNAANATYGEARVGKASALADKLDSYFVNHWLNGTMITGVEGRGCNPSLKKDTAKVLALLGNIRANEALNAQCAKLSGLEPQPGDIP